RRAVLPADAASSMPSLASVRGLGCPVTAIFSDRWNSRSAARVASLRPVRLGYYNTLLFPLAAIGRLARRGAARRGGGALGVPPAFVNRTLHHVFAAEAALIGRTFFPYGLSVIGLFTPTTASR